MPDGPSFGTGRETGSPSPRATAPQEFQSTPPAEARGDVARRVDLNKVTCFNPLPPPKRGETVVSVIEPASYVFQSTPPRRSEGRQATEQAVTIFYLFQSTPPAEARGDSFEDLVGCRSLMFQSTPPAEARGDF